MGNLNPNYMLGIYIWLGLYHKYYCTLWSFEESGYYSILKNVEVMGMQISNNYVDSSRIGTSAKFTDNVPLI